MFFAHDDAERAARYSVLVFDNRGVGESGVPWSRYSTREMALDVIELMYHVGWLGKEEVQEFAGINRLAPRASFVGQNGRNSIDSRTPATNTNNQSRNQNGHSESCNLRDLNIAGVSMGGMIGQELLACLPPERISSVFLLSTAPRLIRTVPFLTNLSQRITMFLPRPLDAQLQDIADRLFHASFLDAPDQDARLHPDMCRGLAFDSNRDRILAGELMKRREGGFGALGFVLQAVAAGWHWMDDERIRLVVDKIGRRRVCVMHGREDRMLTFVHFEALKQALGGDETDAVDQKVGNGNHDTEDRNETKLQLAQENKSANTVTNTSNRRDRDTAPAPAAGLTTAKTQKQSQGPKYIVFENTGHVIGYEHEEEFNRAMDEFMSAMAGDLTG